MRFLFVSFIQSGQTNKQFCIQICNSCKIMPSVNQVELHPYLTQPELVQFCRERNIVVTAYSPLGSPGSPSALPTNPNLLSDQKVKYIAEKHGKTPAQVLIRFHIENMCSVIPKSSNKERLVSNFDVFNFQLSPEEMQTLHGLNRNFRYCVGKAMHLTIQHPYYPFAP